AGLEIQTLFGKGWKHFSEEPLQQEYFKLNPLSKTGIDMSNPLSYLHDQLEQWRADGTYQRLRILESEAASESRFDGRQVNNLASNNYLGLTTHPKLREAALE